MLENIYIFFYSRAYRTLMKTLHRFNFHYAPETTTDTGTMKWCHWCGFREHTEDPKRKERVIGGPGTAAQ